MTEPSEPVDVPTVEEVADEEAPSNEVVVDPDAEPAPNVQHPE